MITPNNPTQTGEQAMTTETTIKPKKSMTSWERAQAAIEYGNRVLLYGLPGTGKTYFGLNSGLKQGQNSYRLICTEEMTDADLIGTYKQSDNGVWAFSEGVGIKAWREGARLVVDEINRMNGDVESRMMALIDTVASSSWQHPDTGEVVKPHQDFSVVATMNGVPEDLAPAILDRLIVRCEVNTPHPSAIESLPEYLRTMASELTSPERSDRVSLRAFVDFHEVYGKSGSIDLATQVVFPEHYSTIIGTLSVAMTKARNTVEADNA
jgi:MoxR-like ATPase